MIYSSMELADSTLSMFRYLHDEDVTYILNAYKGLGESGYTLIHESNRSVSFAQSAAGDSLVIYPSTRWDILKLTDEERDDISVFYGCDDIFNAVKWMMDYLDIGVLRM